MEPEKLVMDYLKRVEEEEGYARITHSNADGSPCQYSYWYDRDKFSSLCGRVNFRDLVELDEIRILQDKIILWEGSSDEVTLPIEYDIGKIRRRLEDHLRKTNPEEIIRLAMRANIKLS